MRLGRRRNELPHAQHTACFKRPRRGVGEQQVSPAIKQHHPVRESFQHIECGALHGPVTVEFKSQRDRAAQMRHQPVKQLALIRSERALPCASADAEGSPKILLRRKHDHSVTSHILRPQNFVKKICLAQRRKPDRIVGKNHPADRLVLHILRPYVLHVPRLVDAVAFRIEAAVVSRNRSGWRSWTGRTGRRPGFA